MHSNQARFNMIEQQIRPWNVLDLQVLELLGTIHREDFVPEAHRALAFADTEIPLPAGQCMLAPRLEARMLQDLMVQPHETVLEIGAGSGFMAALLAHRARQVLTLEIVPELAAMARSNLTKAGLGNVTVREADGSKLGASEGKFDVIVLSGSVGQVPQDLLQHLTIGGRLGVIVGDDPVMQCTIVTRTSETDFRSSAPGKPWSSACKALQSLHASSFKPRNESHDQSNPSHRPRGLVRQRRRQRPALGAGCARAPRAGFGQCGAGRIRSHRDSHGGDTGAPVRAAHRPADCLLVPPRCAQHASCHVSAKPRLCRAGQYRRRY